MKIGIPQALYFFKYGRVWENFFKRLGCEVILSPPTNKKILTEGVELAVEEVCIPLKVFYGHCRSLIGKCDFVFIPRYISLIKNTYTCPRFLVLPDVTRFTVKNLPILTISIKGKERPGMLQFLLFGIKMRKKASLKDMKNFVNVAKMQRIFNSCQDEEIEEKKKLKDKFSSLLERDNLKVMLVGHPYNLKDNYINKDILEKLKTLDVTVITPDEVPSFLIQKELKELPFIYWSEEQNIAGSAYVGLKDSRINGLIIVSSFGCGPDSLVAEQIVRDAQKFSKPVIHLFFDENTTDINIQTRLEAFVDMLRRKK